MVSFAELVETVEHLSEDERDELWAILRKKKRGGNFESIKRRFERI